MAPHYPSPIPSSRPSLASLPTELLTQIARELPRSSAVSFALIARRFTLPAESGIWRELDISLNPHYGEHPRVQPHSRETGDAYITWAQTEARRAEERHRKGLRRKVKKIMMVSSERKLGMLERVAVTPREGVVAGIISLLDMVSGSLFSLDLHAPETHRFEKDWRSIDFEILDVKWINSGISFPSLTHLRLRKHSIRYFEFLVVLCHAAPNLISLEADLHYDFEFADWVSEQDLIPAYPEPALKPNKMRRLALAVPYGYCDTIVAIITASPHLRQVAIGNIRGSCNSPKHILGGLAALKELEDLYIDLEPSDICYHVRDEKEGQFPALRRLVLRSHYPRPLEETPRLPRLESLYIEREEPRAITIWPSTTGFPERTPATNSMIPMFAAGLAGRPHLRAIHYLPPLAARGSVDVFDQLNEYEEQGRPMGVIRSLSHQREELVHARLLLQYVQKSDEPLAVRQPSQFDPTLVRYIYRAKDGIRRERTYALLPGLECVWQDFVDYDGHGVPMEILQQMRYAAGAKLGDWEGRGVEVGSAAWKVLTDWRDAQVVVGAMRRRG